jgi:hypothetical protein
MLTENQYLALRAPLHELAQIVGLDAADQPTMATISSLLVCLAESRKAGVSIDFECRTFEGRVAEWTVRNGVTGRIGGGMLFKADGSTAAIKVD